MKTKFSLLNRIMFKHIFKKRILLIFLGFVLITQTISGCMQFRMSDKKMKKFFASCTPTPVSQQYEVNKRKVHYVSIGSEDKQPLLFVHGSPGGWNAFEGYFKDTVLVQKFKIMSVDRLGYGKSGFGKEEKSLEKQAAAFLPILEAQKKPVVLVGHSLGGPTIARMAMDYPDKVKALVFIAPSIDPALEKTKWMQYPAHWRLTRWMVPKVLRVCNEEILPLKGELEKMLPLWKNIKCPIIFVQGGKDKLVPPGNLDFGKKQLVNTQVVEMFYPDLNHFIPFTRPDIVREAILKTIQ